MKEIDKKAKNILFKTYWSSQGWIMDEHPKTDSADFEYAKEKGVMFDRLTISVDQLLERLNGIFHAIPQKKVTDAFLNSLTNKRLDWRSGLGSYGNARRLLADPSSSNYLLDHGEDLDLNVLNFERIKWGGVRFFGALYNWLDLELLYKEDVPAPSQESINILQAILDVIEHSEKNDSPSHLRDNLKKVFNVSKNERHLLMEILGAVKILKPSRYERKEPGKHDWHFVLHWRGEDRTTCSKILIRSLLKMKNY